MKHLENAEQNSHSYERIVDDHVFFLFAVALSLGMSITVMTAKMERSPINPKAFIKAPRSGTEKFYLLSVTAESLPTGNFLLIRRLRDHPRPFNCELYLDIDISIPVKLVPVVYYFFKILIVMLI